MTRASRWSALAAAAPDALTLFAGTSAALRRIVPFDAAIWQATDPDTGLATAPMRAENLGEDGCAVYWNNEFLAETVTTFRELANADVPVAGLWETTGGEPQRSAVHRTFLRPRGLDDELRAVLRADGQWWGQVSLYRAEGRKPFTRADLAVVAGLTTTLGARLRSFALPPAAMPEDRGPGLLLFDAGGTLLSINDEGRALLAELPPGPSSATAFGVAVPAWVHNTAARAVNGDTTRVRARDRHGRWLVVHASALRGAGTGPSQCVVVVEPAKAGDVACLIAAAYGLTDRELEVTQLLARGLSTAQLARRLVLSQHTVRDHVKSVFAKTGVSSRGELVALLYTEHYRPLNPGTRVRVWDADAQD